MPPPAHRDPPPPQPGAGESWRQRCRRWRAGLAGFSPRECWWWLLDQWETQRGLRRLTYVTLAVVALGATWWLGLDPWLTRRNALTIARGWIDAGRMDYAAEAAKVALAAAPDRAESWQLAAEVSRRLKNPSQALIYSSNAAKLAPTNTTLVLEWATDELLASHFDMAQQALATLPPEVLASSAPAHRIAGEIARRQFQLTAARDHFEAALNLDGPAAIDEVPLGTVLLHARAQAERDRGLSLLTRWTKDPVWGATALRTLLDDAVQRDDHPAMLELADALRSHPRCTVGDIPACLLALSRADPAHCSAVLRFMEQDHAGNPTAIGLMLGWLEQLGRQDEAVQWFRSLPPSLTRQAPALVAGAEALRQVSAWEELRTWVAAGDWSGEREFLGTVYALAAARALKQTAAADELWQTLQKRTRGHGGQALFAADLIYAWGWLDDAVTLLWTAADAPDTAVLALGTLVRHYQVQRDADGQYRAYSRLHTLRMQDPAIANNYAYFAILTGNKPLSVGKIARDNHARDPANLAYLSTYAFWLCEENRANEALALLKPVADKWPQTPPVAFAYGLALAGTGQKAEARKVLASLNAGLQSTREEALIKARLN